VIAGDNKSDLTCVLYSGGRLRWSSRRVFHILSTFGALCKFTAIENSRPPTFLVCFNNYIHGCETIDTLDGQYTAGFHMGLAYTDTNYHASKSQAIRMQYQDYAMKQDGRGQAEEPCYPGPLCPQVHSIVDRDTGGSGGSRSVFQLEDDRRLGLDLFCPKPLIAGGNGFRTSRHDSGADSAGNLDYGPIGSMNPLARSVVSASGSQDVEEEGLQCYRDTIPQGGDDLHNQLQVPGKNVIDLERIQRGLDTRTTVR